MRDLMTRRFRVVMSLVAAGSAAACGDSTGARLMRPASLTVIPAAFTLDALGAAQELDATVRDALGNTVTGVQVTFNSTDEHVATVTTTGQVVAVGPGVAEIVASADSLTRSSQVTVAPIPAEVVKVSGDDQADVVTRTLGMPLVVQVNDRLENPVSGIAVTFSLGSGPGALGAERDTTGADGRASTELTLGTEAGPRYEVTASAVVGRANPAIFSASGLADAADSASPAGGDQQRQPVNTVLPTPLVVRVTDRYGNGVENHPVTFSVTSGQGFVSPADVLTDAAGEARTSWTLGGVLGSQAVTADVGTLSGAPVIFSAEGTDLAIAGIEPATLVEGQAATVTGVGFDPVLENNGVSIDGRPATVTGATATTLDIVVPPGACQPPQDVDVTVTTALGGTTPPTRHPAAPGSVVSLAVGAHALVQDPADFCLHFAETADTEEYLVGIQSTASTAASVTPIRLIGEAAGAAAAPIPSRAWPSAAAAPDRTASVARWERHRAAEVSIRLAERALLAGGLGSAVRGAAPRAAPVDSTVEVGQSVTVNLPTLGENLCTDFTEVAAVVKAKGARSIWLHDPKNPVGGFTDADYAALSDAMDTAIYEADVTYFGEPTDLDQNGRVVVLVSEELNRASSTVLGFVSLADLFAGECPAANGGEIYYGRAPDPDGETGFRYSREEALSDAPALIAHEFSHVIQAGRRLLVNNRTSFMASFMAEGQATLAEEVVGHAVLGNAPGQNYGYDVGFNTSGASSTPWYAVGLSDVAFYFGNNPATPRTSVPGAPHACSWFARDPSPCGGRALWYGVTWSFLRWISDQYGAAFPGGEPDIHRQLVDNSRVGLANIEDVVGVAIDSLLGGWGVALYADDRVPGLAPEVTIPSWNYFDIFEVNQPRSASITPGEVTFEDTDARLDVRAGSAAYYLIGGAGRSATAFRVRDTFDDELPSFMQIFVVRVQ